MLQCTAAYRASQKPSHRSYSESARGWNDWHDCRPAMAAVQ